MDINENQPNKVCFNHSIKEKEFHVIHFLAYKNLLNKEIIILVEKKNKNQEDLHRLKQLLTSLEFMEKLFITLPTQIWINILLNIRLKVYNPYENVIEYGESFY